MDVNPKNRNHARNVFLLELESFNNSGVHQSGTRECAAKPPRIENVKALFPQNMVQLLPTSARRCRFQGLKVDPQSLQFFLFELAEHFSWHEFVI